MTPKSLSHAHALMPVVQQDSLSIRELMGQTNVHDHVSHCRVLIVESTRRVY